MIDRMCDEAGDPTGPDGPLAALMREDAMLRAEIRVARQAAELTAQLVVAQFEELERVLTRFQEANAERQAVLDAATRMSIIATDLDGTIRLFNRGAELMLGWTASEVVGRLPLFAVHDAGEIAERGRRLAETSPHPSTGPLSGLDILTRLALSGGSDPSEWTYVRKDLSQFPVHLSITAMKGAEDEVAGYLTVAMDLTERKQAEERAARYAAYLNTVLENLPQGVSVFNANLELVLWNPAFAQVLDLPRPMIRKGLHLRDILDFNAQRGEYGPCDIEEYVEGRLKQARDFAAFRFERIRPNGQIIEVQSRPIRLEGRSTGFVTTYTNVTESRRAQDTIRRAGELMEDAIAFSPIFVWEVDHLGVLTFVQGSQKVLGYTPDEMKGRHFASFRCRETRCRGLWNAVDEAMRAFRAFDHRLICSTNRTGGHVWLSMSAHPIYDARGRYAGYRGVNMDVTELTNAKEELERVALHDTLTGLANRRKFTDFYGAEIRRRERAGHPLSLLIADIDHFKQVNDQYGHLVGDVCLKRVAAVLEGGVRVCDLVARFGGEEFIILLPETDETGAGRIAERLRQAVAALDMPVESLEKMLKVTISIGIATTIAEAPEFDTLMKLADDGLYAAKQSGRNRVCCRPAR